MDRIPILIVDDRDSDRFLLKYYLDRTGIDITVFEAEHGREAVEFLQGYDQGRELPGNDFPPLIIFLDINMPIMDGFQFLERFSDLRRELDYGRTVVVMYTSSELEEDLVRAEAFDFVQGSITKGAFSPEDLAEVIRSCTEA